MEKVQTVSEKTKKLQLIYGNPSVHGVWRFSDPPVGSMENATNQKSDFFFFLTMVKMYSNKPRTNHLGI